MNSPQSTIHSPRSAKMLVIGDSPTENTGFACVVRNTIQHWEPFFDIDIWGINYNGWPHEYPYRIFPAGKKWEHPESLSKLLNFIRASDYTHVWILQDLFLLAEQGFPKFLKDVCVDKEIRLLTYYPVDAPLEPEWLGMPRLSDVSATFTKYGETETLMAAKGNPIKALHVIPHGVDTDIFRPLEAEVRKKLREDYFPPAWQKSCILVNVNRNERRKAMVHSLQVLKRLRDKSSMGYKLYLHCPRKNQMEQIDLKQLGDAMGLEYGKDWFLPNEADFQRGLGQFSEEQMNELYNAADLCITTTLGEGWGLSLTEAAAAGMRVVGPHNTSLPEIAAIVGDRMRLAPVSNIAIANVGDNSRVRHAVDVEAMADKISGFNNSYERLPLSDEAKRTLSWERIGKSWLELF